MYSVVSMTGLYIHVPFCVRKCKYCDFYSVPMRDGRGLPYPSACEMPSRFLDALAVELDELPAGFRPDTVFIGGGTPTSLPVSEFGRLLELLRSHVDPATVTEWTCEANPGALDREKVRLLRDAGVNRMSLGIQSFDEQTLTFLGRIHSPTDARDAFQLLRDEGFSNINIDLIYGIPVASRKIVRKDLEQLIALDPEHVAAYALIFEEETEITRLRDEGALDELNDDEQLEQYRLVRRLLEEAGYEHYEISNFAKPGGACRHNVLYWSGGEYIGCGPAAHSHWEGVRYSNVRDVKMYCEAIVEGRSARDSEERLDPEAKARESLVMGLRMIDGVTREDFLERTGFDYMELRGEEIRWLRGHDLVEHSDGRLRLTEKGLFVSDSVFAELV